MGLLSPMSPYPWSSVITNMLFGRSNTTLASKLFRAIAGKKMLSETEITATDRIFNLHNMQIIGSVFCKIMTTFLFHKLIKNRTIR